MDQVAEVKQKTDIVELIRQHLPLKKAGRNYKANCPFHEERTPSFMVNPELQIYKCFGCGESGDAFTFLEKYEGMDFPEALKTLADKAGIKLKPISPQASGEKQNLYKINQMAADFYHYILLKHPLGKNALQYLIKERELSPETIKTFKLGFAPDNPRALSKYLVQKKGINHQDLIKAGLSISTQRGLIDRFYGRVIFPLFDHRGNHVGLSGRLMPTDTRTNVGKYINSPDSPVYHKSLVLYGLNLTRADIKKAQNAIIVEGELDLLSPWQRGIKNIVAVKGTALTQEQVSHLSRLTNQLILALDADVAGAKAARRGITLAQDAGLQVKVASPGKYKDPDDFARADISGFKSALTNPVDVWDFLIETAIKDHDLDTGSGKASASRAVVPVLASIKDQIVAAHYINHVSSLLSVPREAIIEQMKKEPALLDEPSLPTKTQAKEKKPRRQLLEERLLLLTVQNGALLQTQVPLKQLITTRLVQKIFSHLESYLKENKSLNLAQFQKTLPAELVEGFSDIILSSEEEPTPSSLQKELKETLHQLNNITVKEQLEQLSQKITKLEAQGNTSELKQAQVKFSQVSEKLL